MDKRQIVKQKPNKIFDQMVLRKMEEISKTKQPLLPYSSNDAAALVLRKFIAQYVEVIIYTSPAASEYNRENCLIRSQDDEGIQTLFSSSTLAESLSKAFILYFDGVYGEFSTARIPVETTETDFGCCVVLPFKK